jgi:rod shape-determining protein MreD
VTTTRLVIVSIISLWIAAVFQQVLAPRFAIFGVRPDFLLIVLVPLSLFVNRSTAAVLGFFAGLLYGAAAGANLTHYAVSRTLAGFAGSWSKATGLELNLVVLAITTAIVTVLAQMVWMFLAAPSGVLSFLGDTIGSAMYNGVLAVPFYMLLRRVLVPNARSGF